MDIIIAVLIVIGFLGLGEDIKELAKQNKETNCLLRVIAEGKQADENTCPSPDTDTSIDTQDGE